MFRLSKQIEKLEGRVQNRFGKLLDRHRGKWKFYLMLSAVGLYFYGMVINSIRLGIMSTFGTEQVDSIWTANPFANLFAIFTPTGLSVTAVGFLLFCLVTKKGYIFFSGYKFIRDKRGFDILPDGTHGTSKFLTAKEARKFMEVGQIADLNGVLFGKYKEKTTDSDMYADYLAFNGMSGLNNNIIVFGAPGSGKTRGFVNPFLLQCAKRKESVIITDAKGELFEQTSEFFRKQGYEVRACNLLDMEHSDGWNCFYSLDVEPQLVQTVAATIIANTSNLKETDDFWSKAELNLLMALIHYICNLTDPRTGELLPIEQRSLGSVYRMLSTMSIGQINKKLTALPKEHPAKGPHGLFIQAKENIWGNIAIGLGNRLAIYQSELVDKITRGNEIDLLLPGRKPCVYYVIISAQDNSYRFLSSLFFSIAFPRLADYARLHGERGRLPVTVNFCMEEYCNIGYLPSMNEVLSSVRGFNMNCQLVVQSLAQMQHRYPGKEWETQVANCDVKLYLGCNDISTADLISKTCGKTTITVTNNQMPLMPLFSPVYTSTRPYSQTRSNTARDLMMPDEVLRLDNRYCLALLRGKSPLLLEKITPEEHPYFEQLQYSKIIDYIPKWRDGEPISLWSDTDEQQDEPSIEEEDSMGVGDDIPPPPPPLKSDAAPDRPIIPKHMKYIPTPPSQEPSRLGALSRVERDNAETDPSDILDGARWQ